MKCPFCHETTDDATPLVTVQGAEAHRRCYESANRGPQGTDFREKVSLDDRPSETGNGTSWKNLKEREIRE